MRMVESRRRDEKDRSCVAERARENVSEGGRERERERVDRGKASTDASCAGPIGKTADARQSKLPPPLSPARLAVQDPVSCSLYRASFQSPDTPAGIVGAACTTRDRHDPIASRALLVREPNCAVGLKTAAGPFDFISSAQRTSARPAALRSAIKLPPTDHRWSPGNITVQLLWVSPSSSCLFPSRIPPLCCPPDPEHSRGEASPLARPRTGVLERACRSDTSTPGCPPAICALPMIISTCGRSMATPNRCPARAPPRCAPRSTPTPLTRVI